MKLDWEVVRDVLIALEGAKTPRAYVAHTAFPGHDAQLVGYHMGLMAEAGLLELAGGRVMYSNTGDNRINGAMALRLTLEGHKLLAVLNSDSVWSRVKDRFTAAGAAMTLASVGKVAESVTASLLGLSP